MRNPGGYAVIISPDPQVARFDRIRREEIKAGTYECDTFTCCHCCRVVHVRPKASPDEFGSMCRNCMKMVCPICANGPCVPWLKKIEEQEERSYRLRCYGD